MQDAVKDNNASLLEQLIGVMEVKIKESHDILLARIEVLTERLTELEQQSRGEGGDGGRGASSHNWPRRGEQRQQGLRHSRLRRGGAR